jgi:hypothetical protein
MWLWLSELHRLGFRRRSERYWQCERRYGLPGSAYLSVFSHAQEVERTGLHGGRERVDVSAFHVTFCLGLDRVHFYYHEAAEAVWEAGGHTSIPEIRRYAVDPTELRARADQIAARMVTALGAELLPRSQSKGGGRLDRPGTG